MIFRILLGSTMQKRLFQHLPEEKNNGVVKWSKGMQGNRGKVKRERVGGAGVKGVWAWTASCRRCADDEHDYLCSHTNWATQIEIKSTVDSYQQNQTLCTNVPTLTETTGTLRWNLLKPIRQPMQLMTFQSCHDQVLYWFIEVALYAQIFSLVSPFIAPSCTKMTLQDELILVLVKL